MALSSKQALTVSLAVFALLLCGLYYLSRDTDETQSGERARRARSTAGADENADGNAKSATAGAADSRSVGVAIVGSGSAQISGDVRFSATDSPASGAMVSLRLPSGKSARVQQDVNSGTALNVGATPTFFVGGQMVTGFRTASQLGAIIDRHLGG